MNGEATAAEDYVSYLTPPALSIHFDKLREGIKQHLRAFVRHTTLI